jgi:IS30 family transposase
MSQFSISGRVICGQRAAIPSKPSKRQGDLSHTRHPRVIETLRQSRNHPPQQREEGDLVVGPENSGIVTLVERNTRFALIGRLPGARDSATVIDVLRHQIMRLPEELRQTLTWDQGQEMSRHREFTIATGCPVFFCDPHSPWQRGSNENLNGLIRDYYPKGTNFNSIPDDAIEAMVDQLNDRPRKTLGFHTPREKLNELISSVALAP